MMNFQVDITDKNEDINTRMIVDSLANNNPPDDKIDQVNQSSLSSI